MKSFVYILTLWVLVLSARPCVDKPVGNILQNHEISQNTSQDNHKTSGDFCSPFCTCQCCQTTFFVSDGAPVSPASELLFSYTQYSSNFKSLDPSELLIPPKA